ncbi:TPA: DUF1576 domain-containing protein [Streptococcus suis]
MEQIKTHYVRQYYLLGAGIMSLCFAFISPDMMRLLPNYVTYLLHSTLLTQDTFYIAGPAVAFFNAASLFFFYFIISRHHITVEVNGMQTAAVFLSIGHSFFGLHLVNALPIFLGIYLYSVWTHQSFKRFLNLSIFATGIGPLVSLLLSLDLPLTTRLILLVVVGTFTGFIMPPLAEHFLKFHQGFSLYNIGFTTGMVAMFCKLLLPYFQVHLDRHYYVSSQYHNLIMAYLMTTVSIFFLLALPIKKSYFTDLFSLNKRTGLLPDDFFVKFDNATVWLNMAINVSVYTLILYLLNVQFSGPVLGGLFSILGFSAFGKHLRNSLPLSAGVMIAASLQGLDISSTGVIIPFLFATSLAPVAGYYGIFAGLVAGFIHFNLTGVTLDLHQGMTLYNNGFSSGFVAAFLVPIFETIRQHHPHQ